MKVCHKIRIIPWEVWLKTASFKCDKWIECTKTQCSDWKIVHETTIDHADNSIRKNLQCSEDSPKGWIQNA